MSEIELTEEEFDEVKKVVKRNLVAFFEQVDKKLESCKHDDELTFVQTCTLSFLIIGLTVMLKKIDPEKKNEAIRNMIQHLEESYID
jgi:hypothetical protein